MSINANVINATGINAKRYRLEFRFWLDTHQDDQCGLADQLEQLKHRRRFAPTIRAALMLYLDLMAGRTDELYRLFPGLKITHNSPQQQPMPVTALQVQSTPKFKSTPDELELNFEVKQATLSKDTNPTWNLLISSALQIIGSCEELPLEVIEYGLRTGRIPPDKAPKKVAPKPTPAASKGGGPKQMAGTENLNFAPPEDIELDFGWSE